ncbi:cell wall protein [Schaalia odontolytica]|uniref:Cell wall protein n=1 Tax=Schaalia odontolytica TaxID=1660 RepID=A0A0V8RSV0_9ACTO|nr:cell wall protein [Schaalia odontolytica]QCT35306.1 cell wall protein [Schaalia odontolytica]
MRKSQRVLATGAGLALVATGTLTMFAPRSAQADAQPFPLSQYVSSTSTTVCNANPVITTYHGTVVLDIPVTTLLAGHEAEIRAAAAQGLSPHDSGANFDSDIALTLSVPQTVTLGTSRAKSTSSMIAYTSFSPGDDRTQVTANIQLKDLNWQQLLDIYDAEKDNPGQHTIKVQVPYAVGTTDPTEATRLASEQVTVTGKFNFFASATAPAQVFHFDTKTLALAQSPTDCFASAPTRTTRWVDEEDGHDLQPPKTGPNFFQAAGIPDYEFSTWELSSDRLTGIYKYKKVFGTLPVNGDDPTIDNDFKVGLDGNTPTQTEKIYAESKDSLLTIENVVHLKDLRGGRIADLLQKYDETPNAFDDIALKNAHLGFTTQITLPAQLKFSDPSAISVTGLPQGFSATTVAVNGQTATVSVDFDTPEQITTIEALKDAMAALHGEAVITISKIAFTESATADTDYQIDHLTQGTISVDVEKQLGVTVRPGTPSPACPPTMGDYDAVEPAEPRSVLGTVFDPPSPACPPTGIPFSAGWRAPMTGPSAGWNEAPLMVHPLKYTTSESHPYVTRLSFKPGPTPTPTTVTPSVPPTPATQLAKTGALTGNVLALAAVTGTIGAAAMRRKRS